MVKKDSYTVWARSLEPYTGWHPLTPGLTRDKAEAAAKSGQLSSDKYAQYLRYWVGPDGSTPPPIDSSNPKDEHATT